jgi:hypothetical protein
MSLLVDLQRVGGIQDYLLVGLADRQHDHNADPADGRRTGQLLCLLSGGAPE